MNSENANDRLSLLLNKHNKKSQIIKIGGLLLMLIGISASLIYNFYLKTDNIEIKNDLTSKAVVVDSLIKRTDSIASRKDTIVAIIKDFIRIKEDSVSIDKFYADTIERYYLLKNITLDQVKDERKKYNLKHPVANVKYNTSDIHVEVNNKDTVEAFVNVLYGRDNPQELIYQIKFNSRNKIFFVRNLLPTKK